MKIPAVAFEQLLPSVEKIDTDISTPLFFSDFMLQPEEDDAPRTEITDVSDENLAENNIPCDPAWMPAFIPLHRPVNEELNILTVDSNPIGDDLQSTSNNVLISNPEQIAIPTPELPLESNQAQPTKTMPQQSAQITIDPESLIIEDTLSKDVTAEVKELSPASKITNKNDAIPSLSHEIIPPSLHEIIPPALHEIIPRTLDNAIASPLIEVKNSVIPPQAITKPDFISSKTNNISQSNWTEPFSSLFNTWTTTPTPLTVNNPSTVTMPKTELLLLKKEVGLMPDNLNMETYSAKIKVHPQNLGEISAEINIHEGKAGIQFTCENTQVKHFIEANRPQLQACFQQANLELSQVKIDMQFNKQHDNTKPNRPHKDEESETTHVVSKPLTSQNGTVALIDFYA